MASTQTIQTIPPTFYQVAWNADPNQTSTPPWWTDVASRVQFAWPADRGRHYELDQNETGEWRPTLANADGALDPTNTASPYAPGLVPYRQARIRCLPGINALTIDQAVAGEGSGYAPGPVPSQMLVSCGAGYPLTLAASGTAYQGTQVYQVAVPSGAANPKDLLNIAQVPALPGTLYTAQIQARMLATAANLTVSVAVDWYNSSAAIISTTSGSGTALTGGSTTWVQLSATGTAPAGTVYCQIRAVLGTTTAATATFQADGLQLETNPIPTLFQVPNTVSANVLPRNLATAGLALGGVVSGWFTPSGAGTVAYAAGLTAAPTGHTTAAAWTSPPSTGPTLTFGDPTQTQGTYTQVNAGTQYTASLYALRAASADATLNINVQIAWYNSSLAAISTSGGANVTLSTTVWGRVSLAATAPAGALWGRLFIAITTPGTTTATNVVYVTGLQLEAAGSASTWRDPGTAYSIITPYLERLPQSWSQLSGTYGTVDTVGVDAFSALSQFTLADPFVQELLALAPNFLYELAEPAGSTACADSAGRRVPAPVENSPAGAGSLVLGNPVTAAVVPSGGFLGSAGTVATFNNTPTAGTGNNQYAETYVSLHKTTVAPGPPPNGNWTRIVHFRASTLPGVTGTFTVWGSFPATGGIASGFFWVQLTDSTVNGQLQMAVYGTSGNVQYTGAVSLCDGNWHQVAVTCDGAGNIKMYLDGAALTTAGTSITLPMVPSGNDVVGAALNSGGIDRGMVGDIALVCELPLAVSAAQVTNLYNSWRTASTGESTGARVRRVLSWIGWTGPSAIDNGSTTSMGPATDLAGATALDALNNITLTENGNFYVSSTGTVTFKSRSSRYSQSTPVYVFGEQTSAGEWPFEWLDFEFDPSHIMSDVQVTQYGGPTVLAFDAASRARSFPRTYQRTVNTTSVPEITDAANYLLSQNKVARQRVDTLRLHPSAMPGLFAVCLNLELGTRIRVNRRPQGAPPIVFDGFVEHVGWEWDPDSGEVFVTLQCSPADLVKYWILAALHTTLNLQAASGQNKATINALPDAAVNKLASSLPSGYQLTFEPGTVRAETMTLAAGGIPSTSLGYSSAQLTFTANFGFTHGVGTTVCEPLPAGVTDPTVYDSRSVLGAASTTLAAAATAGTSSIVINALPDAKINSLASSVPQSWVIWLSPGTANFETATVAPTGIPTTYPGWTSAVLTLTGNLAHNHAAGDVVCDVLPAGVTAPSAVLATTIPAY